MNTIELKNIKKVYCTGKVEFAAIKNVSLAIKKGEFCVLAGPSGSGKTTILNIVGAMDKVDNGNVIVANTDITNMSHKKTAIFRREQIGFIFQSYNLIPVLNAYENIELALDLLKKYNKNEKKYMIDKIMEEVDIIELKNRRPLEMSGGQQQRVAIARALVKNPDIILADEPTANLDLETGENILKIMKKMNIEKNVTFLFSSHDVKIIELAERVIKLRDGEVVKEAKNNDI